MTQPLYNIIKARRIVLYWPFAVTLDGERAFFEYARLLATYAAAQARTL